ncbi:hypothetical protein GCM10010170_067410 [Dactylosporangium salmoneum]|uniref:Uncharacterized protein n=1 Tax=Dactylosporangium salmoneum TaxID=53361 RepID=A0ABN3H3N4_9ACTN
MPTGWGADGSSAVEAMAPDAARAMTAVAATSSCFRYLIAGQRKPGPVHPFKPEAAVIPRYGDLS